MRKNLLEFDEGAQRCLSEARDATGSGGPQRYGHGDSLVIIQRKRR
jgi:hypothetical protein